MREVRDGASATGPDTGAVALLDASFTAESGNTSSPRVDSGAGAEAGELIADASKPPSCTAVTETCDGKDNDCDGVIDNDVTNDCGGCGEIEASHAVGMPCDNGGRGACAKPGSWQCDGATTACKAPDPMPSKEVCDGRDNDCDGVVDNDVMKNDCGGCGVLANAKGEKCDNGLLGECAGPGSYVCSGADSVVCQAPQKSGTAEVCDGKDNDCNGVADDKATDAIRWYRDCDGDGFAASATGAVSACAAPKLAGTCKAWTDRQPEGATTTDCDDDSTLYHPGAEYGIPTGSNPSNDLNCDGKVDALATLTAADATELNLCAYSVSCDCHAPWIRNGVGEPGWSEWLSDKMNIAFHPPIACSRDQNDKLTVLRYTSGPNKLFPDQACSTQGTVSGGVSRPDTWTAYQRCR
jgi:Putative metal-binding motif